MDAIWMTEKRLGEGCFIPFKTHTDRVFVFSDGFGDGALPVVDGHIESDAADVTSYNTDHPFFHGQQIKSRNSKDIRGRRPEVNSPKTYRPVHNDCCRITSDLGEAVSKKPSVDFDPRYVYAGGGFCQSSSKVLQGPSSKPRGQTGHNKGPPQFG